jgi:hypothetical protein
MNKNSSKQNNKFNKFNNSNKIRKNLLKKCGLPDTMETSHCFNDATHHTCCLLGNDARKYADETGNPIGALSESVQNNKKLKLIPWCTCTGSKVCSFYSKKFGKKDGTRIKFIGTLQPKKTRKNKNNKNGRDKNGMDKNDNNWNENNAISKLNLIRHRTPGIL